MKKILETERLILREFTLADAAFILQLLNTEAWLKNIGDRNVKTLEQAEIYLLNGPIKSYAENGFGLCMIEIKEGGFPAGMCGIIKRANMNKPDIGFAFLPGYMGMGYATEIAKATLAFAKNVLQIPEVCAIVLPSNGASISVLEKAGLQFMEKFSFPGSEELLLLYGG